MADEARGREAVLVHGATGYTGRLVCGALRRRGVPFAIGGRSASRLGELAAELGGVETCVVDLGSVDSVRAAVSGRRVVCACAGPFVEIGEPMLAGCARAGVHYVDTTGEQRFVLDAITRHHATAVASGACVVPGMAFEIALADWGADLAARRVGGAPDAIDVAYLNQPPSGGAATTRGTKRSIVATLAAADGQQFVDGALRRESSAAVVRTFPRTTGEAVHAVSFPSPEAVVVPSHTGARTVRTFMAMDALSARTLQATRGVTPLLVRMTRGLIDRAIARGAEGPDASGRSQTTFEVLVEARRGDRRARLWMTGGDPYGLTAELQAYAAERLLAGTRVYGVVAPSVGVPPHEAIAALAFTGLRVVEDPSNADAPPPAPSARA